MVRRRGRTTWELLLRTSSQAGKTVAVDPIPIATSLVSRSAERFSSFHFIPGVTPDASSSRGEVRARFGVRRHPRDKMLSNGTFLPGDGPAKAEYACTGAAQFIGN
jgi:hypothetical protein